MTRYHPGRVAAALFLALAAAACSPAAQGNATAGPTPRSTPQMTESQARARAIADSVRRSYTPADIAFMTGMIGHHSQALVMAKMAPTHDASPAIRRLAERIINAQEDEIGTMQRWLRERKLPVPAAGDMSHAGGSHAGMDHGEAMPGMLTAAQLQELDQARGTQFDRLFLTYMIQHHNGAITMLEKLFASHGAAQEDLVFKFASDMSADQSTEVGRMLTMLDALPPEGSQ